MIDIVTHVYAGTLPQYAVFLRVQLSSLILYSPMTRFRACVCYSPRDREVGRVLDEFKHILGDKRLVTLPMEERHLFRRSIGRNYFAKGTNADVVWFTDVDHWWGDECLSSLLEMFRDEPGYQSTLVYPQQVWVPKEHAVSDVFWQRHMGSEGLVDGGDVSLNYVPKVYGKPIGGVQIVSGDFARLYGYLDKQAKWQRPAVGDRPFPCFRDDVKFRNFCLDIGDVAPIHLQNVYRLRHSEVTYKHVKRNP